MIKVDTPRIDVLHVTEACGGGVRRHLRLIVPELAAKGLRCAVCGFGHRVEEDFLDDLTLYEKMGCLTEFWSFNHGYVLGLFHYIMHFKALLREWKPAVIHAHSTLAGLACRAAKNALPGVKLVYSPHAFALHQSLPFLVRKTVAGLERWGASLTDAYAFVGRAEIPDANALKLPPNKFHLIENGLPAGFADTMYSREEARRVLQIAPDAKVAVIPCRLVIQKGLDQVVEAMALLKEDCPGLQFMFCGAGPEEEVLRSLAHRLGVEENASFPGPVERLAVLLPAFDLAILPSRYEGLSYVLLECLAAGIPLIVSDIMANIPRPELREILNVFRLGDREHLADTIRRCIREPERTRTRAEQGVKFMQGNFTLDLQIAKLDNLYKILL